MVRAGGLAARGVRALDGERCPGSTLSFRAASRTARKRARSGALDLECGKSKLTPEQAGELAIRNVRVFLADSGLMRHGWGWKKFFAHGYWNRPEAWPYDQQALRELRQRREAAIGSARPG